MSNLCNELPKIRPKLHVVAIGQIFGVMFKALVCGCYLRVVLELLADGFQQLRQVSLGAGVRDLRGMPKGKLYYTGDFY